MNPENYVPTEYLPLFIMLVLATLFAIGGLLLGAFIRPRFYYPEKLEPYECGNEPSGLPWQKIAIRYIPIAILFVVFDVEIAFLYLLGVSFSSISPLALGGAIFFIFLIILGFFYDLKKGYLEWTRF
ncbi:MAG: NADH-quinone oxidoreductase subunit A [Caldimicrobium sp.]|nr:NADH-quinone oxidoreductase subunit A [Caldimicrobium sp.]MDW8182311.1 NADH-quinone oxidoreductase subunit A [Caldimicrobium sp.]